MRTRITTGKQGRTPQGAVHINAAELPNPYTEPWLRPRNGRDKHVQQWLLDHPGVATRYSNYLDMIEARKPTTISVTCSAGKHRSVAVGEWLAHELTAQGWEVDLTHRELKTRTTTTATTPKQDMANVTVVTGPPAAGKTTHVREHAQPGDVIIDYDHLANALSGQDADNHVHEAHIQTITRAARTAALDAAIKTSARIWLIHAMPSKKQQVNYSARGAEIITIDPGKDVVMKRIKAKRPARMAKAAGKWYDEHKPKRRGARERGYTHHDHELPRKRLLLAMRDGEPCWWCGLPMHKDKQRNWDGQALAADHSHAHGAKNGEQPDRLLHGRCNSQRQDGRYDARRPALTGKHPSEPLAPQAGARAPQCGQQDDDAAAFVWK